MEEDKTDPGSIGGTFQIVGALLNEKIKRVKEIAAFLDELKNPEDQRVHFWRLPVALKEMLEVGADLHRITCQMVAENPEVEITRPG
jgi:hypothetical protein